MLYLVIASCWEGVGNFPDNDIRDWQRELFGSLKGVGTSADIRE